MFQTTVVDAELSEPLPGVSDIGRDEIFQLIKNEEVGTAFQVILNHLADMVSSRILAKLGAVHPVNPLSEPKVVDKPVRVDNKVAEDQKEATVTQVHQPRKKRQLSDEARRRISESQKARWSSRPRTLSDETKQQISESQRLRWAIRNGTTLPAASPRESTTSTEADTLPQHKDAALTVADNVVVMPAPSEAVLAMQDGYKGDPFYVAFDGHYVGDDGFVVPKNFDEFIDRFPKYIETWVRRRLSGQGIEEDIEDWRQELIIHMKYLPPKSKHRSRGKDDVIQTFDPFAQYGASERRWRNYVNYCLANKYNTIHGKRAKNPICRAGNMSLVSDTNPEIHGEVTDEYIYSKSEYLMDATNREEQKQEDKFFARSFIRYVEECDPDVFPILEAVYEAGSSADTIKEFCQTCKRLATTVELGQGEHVGHQIGIPVKDFNRARTRLKQLAGNFIKKKNRKVVVNS